MGTIYHKETAMSTHVRISYKPGWSEGPWSLSKPWGKPNGGRFLFAGKESHHIADFYMAHHKDDEVTEPIGEANALVASLAPEFADYLWKLLKGCVFDYETHRTEIQVTKLNFKGVQEHEAFILLHRANAIVVEGVNL